MKKMIVLFVAVVITAMSLNAQSVDSTRVNMINITNSSAVARVFFFGWSGGSGTMYVYENYGPGGVSNVNQFYTETYPVPYGTDSLDILLSGLSSSTNYFTDNYISYPFMMNATSPIVSFTTAACALSVSISSVVLNSCSEQLTATAGFSSYQWKRNGANIAGATSSVYVAISDGSYTVVVGDASSCTGTSSAVAVDVDEISITASVDQEICAGESITLTATGGTSYLWSDGSTGSSNSVSPLATTTYTVTGTSDGCSNSDQVQVKVNPLPSVSLTASEDAICVDAVANISFLVSPAGGTLSGTGVSGTSFSHTVAGVGLHTVTYTYTDANGCSNNDDVVITVMAKPIVSGIEYYPGDNNNGVLILNGNFQYQVEVILGDYVYSSGSQSQTTVMFYFFPVINKGQYITVQSVSGGDGACFVMEKYLNVSEPSLDSVEKNKDKRIFDITGKFISDGKDLNNIKFLPNGIYLQGRKKFVVIDGNISF